MHLFIECVVSMHFVVFCEEHILEKIGSGIREVCHLFISTIGKTTNLYVSKVMGWLNIS